MRTKLLIWSITQACNCRCSMCNFWKSDPMFFETSHLSDWIHQLKLNRIKIVSLTGGEPTLHPDLKRIVEELKRGGFWVHIVSNGSNPGKLLELAPFLDAVSVSIDSDIEDEHNTHRGRKVFNRALASLTQLQGRVKILTGNMLITRFNCYKVDIVARFANQLGVPLSISYPLDDAYGFVGVNIPMKHQIHAAYSQAYNRYNELGLGNSKEHYLDCLNHLNGNPTSLCKAGQRVFCADYTCQVYPCFHCHGQRDRLNLDEIWKPADHEGCDECMAQCFREPSLGLIPKARMIWKLWKWGKSHART